MNLEELSLIETARAIRNGSLSPVDYANALLARADKVERKVQAWTTLDRDAVLAEARQCEIEAHDKRFRGPLHGIPIGIKDVFHTKNLRTTFGSPAFHDFVPDRDSAVVRSLRNAGAIIMGKCVTTILMFLDPGPTRNPWNTQHTPGGSSSGSAAAVAAGMVPAAIGSQTVGSIGRPGAYNGVVSIMPTQARIDLEGALPLAWSLDHAGSFARSVADLQLLLESIAASEPYRPDRPFRVGVVRGYFHENADPETRTQFEGLLPKLADSGFHVEEAALPSIFSLAPATLRTILRAEAAAIHDTLIRRKPETYGPKLKELVQTGMLVSAAAYLRAKRIRKHYQRDMLRLFDRFDVLLTPGATGTAPEGMPTGNPAMNAPWSLADFPTLTLPHALGANGLPLGIQLSAAPLQEGLLFEAAKAIEAVLGFSAKPNL